MQWVLAAALVAVMVGREVRADDCAPPGPGEKVVTPWECCPVEGVLPQKMISQIAKCKAKYPVVKPPEAGDKAEVRDRIACIAECVFEEAGFLTNVKTINHKAIDDMFSDVSKKDESYGELLQEVVEMCYYKADKEALKDSECRSGALELEHCLMRESFLRCPGPMWRDTAECNALKGRVDRCPEVPVILLPPGIH